jgi:hypothetical protein
MQYNYEQECINSDAVAATATDDGEVVVCCWW